MVEMAIYILSFAWWSRFRAVPYFQDRAANAVISDSWFSGEGCLYKDIGVTYMPVGVYVFYGLVRKFLGKRVEVLNLAAGAFFSFAPVFAYNITAAMGGSGILTAGITLFLMSNLRFLGTTANYENYSNVFLLALLNAIVVTDEPTAFAASGIGLLYGLLLMVKQVHVLLLPVWMIWLPFFWSGDAVALFLAGMLLPQLLVWLLFMAKGAGIDYLRWNWVEPFLVISRAPVESKSKMKIIYSSTMTQPFKDKWPRIKDCLSSMAPFLLAAAAWSGVSLFSQWRSPDVLLSLVGVATLSMVCLGGGFRPQYWLNIIPWAAIASSLFWSNTLRTFVKTAWTDDVMFLIIFSGVCSLILLTGAVIRDRSFFRTISDPYDYLFRYYKSPAIKAVAEVAKGIDRPASAEECMLVMGHYPELFLYSGWKPYCRTLLFAAPEDYLRKFKANPSDFAYPPDFIFWGREVDYAIRQELENLWNCRLVANRLTASGVLLASEDKKITVSPFDVRSQRTVDYHLNGYKTILYVSRPISDEIVLKILDPLVKWVRRCESHRLVIRLHPHEDSFKLRSFVDKKNGIILDEERDILASFRTGISLCVSPFSRAALYATDYNLPVWLIRTGQNDFNLDPSNIRGVQVVDSGTLSTMLAQWEDTVVVAAQQQENGTRFSS